MDINGSTQINILCIGTPKFVFDAVGPLVGTMLQNSSIEKKYPVNIYGTMEYPITDDTIEYMLNCLDKKAFNIVVDAAMGGLYNTAAHGPGPIILGAAVGKNEHIVGDYHFLGCYGDDIPMNKIPLDISYSLAKKIVKSIYKYMGDNFRWRKYLKQNKLNAGAWMAYFCTHFRA